MRLVLRGTLTLLLAGLSWIYGGPAGLVTLLLYAIAVSPGLLLGAALFGSNHAAGWASGALLGYGLLAIAFWVPVAIGKASLEGFVFAWLVLLLFSNAARTASKGPLIALPAWTRRDSAALLLVLHLVPLLVGSPFARAGERDDAGTRYYRAYFTADFVWHMALTRELARFAPQLKNPYIADEDLHYYWTYFLPPAALATRGEPGGTDQAGWSPSAPTRDPIESALKITAMMTALLLLSMVYLVAWAATGRLWAAMAATAIVVLAPSFEGLYAIYFHWSRDHPFQVLRQLNIDAITAWPDYGFRGLRIDNLPRSMWWTPQHSMSCGLGLIAVLAASRWTSLRLPAAALLGLALGLSVTFNPLLGAAFCAIYGGTVLWDLASRRMAPGGVLTASLAVIPVGLALWWCLAAGMSEGAGGLTFGLHQYARRAPVMALFVALGGVLLPAAIGLLPSRHVPMRPAVPALVALIVGLVLMHFVTIPDASWVGFRAGNVILVTVGLLVARGLAITAHARGRVVALAFAAVIFLAGVPTTAIDWFNARDLENRRMGPGFLWVVPYTPDQQAGFAWIRRATPPDAIVQFDPIVRGRQNWSDVPSFTGRRMAGGLPISLLPGPRQEELASRVHALFTELPPEAAHRDAHALGIDYFWLDAWDRAAPTGGALDRLLARPDLFPPMFSQGSTAVLAVAK